MFFNWLIGLFTFAVLFCAAALVVDWLGIPLTILVGAVIVVAAFLVATASLRRLGQ